MKRQLIHEQIHYWLLLAIAFTMPFSIKLNSVLIIGCLLNHVIGGRLLFYLKSTWKSAANRYMILFFALHVFSLLLSSDVTEAGAILERKLVLLVFPLVLFKPIHQQQFKAIVFAFTAGVVMALAYCIGAAISQYMVFGKTEVFFYHTLAKQINIHAVYLAAYAVFSVFILIYFLKSEKPTIQKWLWLVVVFLVVAVLLLSSKMMLFILCIGLIYQLLSSYAIIRLHKGVFIVTLLVITWITITIPQIRQRFSLEFASDFSVVSQSTYRYDTPFTGTTIRLTIWKYCYQILKRENAWLIGVGSGDSQQLLNEQYKSVHMYTGNPELKDTGYLGYGPHNQYIEVLLTLGVIGLLVFIILLAKQWSLAWVSNSQLWLLFIGMNVLFFMTESAISTNKGIIFFTFFSIIFNSQTMFKPKESTLD